MNDLRLDVRVEERRLAQVRGRDVEVEVRARRVSIVAVFTDSMRARIQSRLKDVWISSLGHMIEAERLF